MTYHVICLVNQTEQTFIYNDCTDAMDALKKFMSDKPDYYDDNSFRVVPVS